MFNAVEVLVLTLVSRLDDDKEIPEPHEEHGEYVHMVAPDVNIQAALLVRFNRGDRKLSDLARTLGTSWPAVARLENPKHWPTLRQLEKVASALGKRLVLSME
jgi:antitoxin HicB